MEATRAQLLPELKQALWSGHDAKLFVERSVAVSNDALHIIVGVIALFGFAAILRRPLSNWLPWAAVLVVLVANEALDFSTGQWPQPAMQLGESAKDLAVTMLVPTLILMTSRYMPGLYGRKRSDEWSARQSQDSDSIAGAVRRPERHG